MVEQYAGEDLFPDDYTIPDDAVQRNAAAVNVALEALGDRTVWLKNRMDLTFDKPHIVFDRWFAPDVLADPTIPSPAKIEDIEASPSLLWQGLTHSTEGQVSISVDGAVAGDVLIFEMSGTAYLLGEASAFVSAAIAGVYSSAEDTFVPGAITFIGDTVVSEATSPLRYQNFSLHGALLLENNTSEGELARPYCQCLEIGMTVGFRPGVTCRVTCIRPTLVVE